MTVSFIVTSYNYAEYILETIESIKNQTYKDFEIIVVDDFSNDNSVEILEKEENIKLIKHDENKGQLASIITGIKESKGEFVSIIDSDDTLNADYADILTKKIKENDVALVTCNCNENKILTVDDASFGGWWWSPMSCGMFKKEVLNCVLDYKNTNFWKICPDKFLFNLAHLQGNSMIIKEKLVCKREHDRNAGKTKNRFLLNLKNNLIIRNESLKVIKDKKLRKIIKKSYPFLFVQIFKKCINF